MYLNAESIDLNDYNYHLPKDKIALYPTAERTESRLLAVNSKNTLFQDDTFCNIGNYIASDSLIVFNSTKVIAARLLLQKNTGGAVELLCVNPVGDSSDPQLSLNSKFSCKWECYVGGRNVKTGMTLYSINSDIQLQAKILKRYSNQAIVEFTYQNDISFSELLEKYGDIPLPPYISRNFEDSDRMRYQTVYSKVEGSVAAPTAGLHFNDSLIAQLKNKGISFTELILHVGPGTFKPIENKVAEHDMHKEMFYANISSIEQIIKSKSNNSLVIATGTTSLRTLESLYWIGVKAYYEKWAIIPDNLLLDQFEAYYLSRDYPELSVIDSYDYLLNLAVKNNQSHITGETKLFILPGYCIQTSEALITNFHLPKSTLLMLVDAFIGREMREKIYNFAINNNYRFLSYGDGSILFR